MASSTPRTGMESVAAAAPVRQLVPRPIHHIAPGHSTLCLALARPVAGRTFVDVHDCCVAPAPHGPKGQARGQLKDTSAAAALWVPCVCAWCANGYVSCLLADGQYETLALNPGEPIRDLTMKLTNRGWFSGKSCIVFG